MPNVAQRIAALALAALFLATVAASCSGDGNGDPFDDASIAFILVGTRDDLGYNQAVWEGADAVARAFPDHPVLRVEEVSEDADVAHAALEDLIDRGARILFATSFGHLAAARRIAEEHPEVVVVHQGGVEPRPRLPNLGTYFGSYYEPLYLAGIAAGGTTETGHLGFVAAFPIPATFLNVDAFTLGARSVRPDAVVDVTFTSSWCDPGAQTRAAEELLAKGADVLAQHQDCTATILGIAERGGVHAVGYHTDGSEAAPRAWLTGAVWRWGALYVDIVTTILSGRFEGSPYDGDYLAAYAGDESVLALASLSPDLAADTRRAIADAERSFAAGATPFDGPITDRDGRVRVAAGVRPTAQQISTFDWFVEGVRGEVP